MKKKLVGVGLVFFVIWIGLMGCRLIQPPAVEPSNTRWLDDFESYPIGTFPPTNWIKSGNATDPDCMVTDIFPPHGNQVFQLQGVYGGNWSAVAYRAVDLSSSHTISFRVRNSNEGGTGYHRFNAAIDLMDGPDWTANGRWLIFFGVDGKIHGAPSLDDGPVLGNYAYDEWYDVEIWYKRTRQSMVLLSYDINGAYVTSVEVPFIAEEWDLTYLGLWSGDTTVWFDDVMVIPH
jgi:hypothetical protein